MHHANIIVGEGDCKNIIFDILEKDLGFNYVGSPDFLQIEKDSFGIDDARDLALWAIGKPLLGEVKVYMIITKSITHEAQNALLKLLEEPPAGTYFFIVLESLGGVLPTVISRVRVLDLSEKLGAGSLELKDSKKFLSADIKGKLSMIRSLSKKENKSEMKDLLRDLEEVAYKNNYKKKDLAKILSAKIFASARGSSPKMLLEWLSSVI